LSLDHDGIVLVSIQTSCIRAFLESRWSRLRQQATTLDVDAVMGALTPARYLASLPGFPAKGGKAPAVDTPPH